MIAHLPAHKAVRHADVACQELLFPDRLLAALILTGIVLLPLTFLPVMEDAFALPKVTLLRVLSGIGLGALALGIVKYQRSGPRIPPVVVVLLLAYISLNCLAFLFSADPGRSVLGEHLQYQGFTTILIYAGTLLVAARVFQSCVNVRLLFWSIALSGLVVSVYAVAQMVDLDPIEWAYGSEPPERAFSSIGQANALAAYLVMVIPVCLCLVLEADRHMRWLPLAMAALATAALVLTFSRSGYVALAVVLTLALVPLSWRLGWRITATGALATCVFVAGVTALVPAVNDAASRAVSIADLDDPSIQKRFGMWMVAGEITLDKPLLGTGHETYPEMFSEYRDANLPGFGEAPARPESPHNNYLAIASSVGLPALIAYAGIIGAFFHCVYRGYSARRPHRTALLLTLAGAATAHLLMDAFMTAEITSSWLFWVLMGTGIGLAASVSPEGRRGTEDAALSRIRYMGWRRAAAAGAVVVGATVILAAALPFTGEAMENGDGTLAAATRAASER